MAGSHQIWIVDLVRSLAIPYAGSGREARVDGSIDDAAFAQPSGLAIGGSTLLVADSEANIIRAVRCRRQMTCERLPAAICSNSATVMAPVTTRAFSILSVSRGFGDQLFVADTYNHRIRTVDPGTGVVATFAGRGEEGHDDGRASDATFYEPGGISATSNALYVADTNNHAIRLVRLDGGPTETVEIRLT